ncbi:ribonuclease H-like domain-containing protein, partial [Tanacetum coccineum]
PDCWRIGRGTIEKLWLVEYDVGDNNVTLVSKLDVNSPLHLHPNDSAALTNVFVKLKGTKNYQVWSCVMLLALEGKNKNGFIDGSCRRSNIDEVLGKQYDRVNAVVLGWILDSISKELFLGQIFLKRASHVWDELNETYDKVDGSMTFNMHHKINSLSQNGSSIANYYHKLNALWKQFDVLILMGLDESYMQIKSNILSREPLHDVINAYAIISSEESHRVVSSTGTSQWSQSSVFNSNVRNRNNVQRPQSSSTSARPGNVTRPSNIRNRRPNGGSAMICKHCGFNGHTIERCFKLIGYPADFRKKNSSNNNNNQGVQNFNRRFLIMVSHPNGTEALITKVGNMKLTEHLTLYDVLVVFEYYASLMSVHKVARDSKFVVAFDESHCYVLPQDLREMKLLGIGKQKDGLYYFDGFQENDLGFEETKFTCNLTKEIWHCRLGHPYD